jgi:hypothetical protein
MPQSSRMAVRGSGAVDRFPEHFALRESVSDSAQESRGMPAPIRPDLGEDFDEQGRFCVFG